MTTHATGTFEVDIKPQPAYVTDANAAVGRMSLDKQFYRTYLADAAEDQARNSFLPGYFFHLLTDRL